MSHAAFLTLVTLVHLWCLLSFPDFRALIDLNSSLFQSIDGGFAMQFLAWARPQPSKFCDLKSGSKFGPLRTRTMNNVDSASCSNFNAQSACTHCEGIFEHAPWCATQDPRTAYAYQIVADASKITAGDALILHSLGVAWVAVA